MVAAGIRAVDEVEDNAGGIVCYEGLFGAILSTFALISVLKEASSVLSI
jgi:hypothetical protein